MGMTYFVLSSILAAVIGTGGYFAYQAIFNPSGWTKKDSYGVAVRFKVFLPLYLQKPEKWKLMPDKARYDDNMTVYFSSGLEWRKYNRWRKRAEKERLKREQEELEQRFHEMIFKDYEPEPNPEFTPPPTVKQKDQKDKPTIIRRELQGRSAVTNLYYGICETEDGLQSDEAGTWAERSAIYCVATDKLYVKGSGGEWREAVTEPNITLPKFEFKEFDEKTAEILQEMARIKNGENQKQDVEVVRIDGAKLVPQPAETCGDCPWASGNYPDVEICRIDHHAHLRSERCKYRKQAVLKPTKTVREGECKKCRYFQKHDKPPFGYCVRNDEITDEAYVKLCFEPIPPIAPIAHKRPEPLGTVTTH